MKRLSTGILAGALLTSSLAVGVASSAGASAPPGCANRNNNTIAKLLECVTLEGVRAHQAAFQAIAANNDDEFYPGTRAAGTEGYDESVEYVAGLLEAAGYTVTLEEVEFQFVFPALLQQLTPPSPPYETGTFTNSGSGDVTANVVGVDLLLPSTGGSTSGCEGLGDADVEATNDFAAFPAGSIALVQRGTCTFADKALNAQAAGAAAVIIFNEGNSPDREGLIVGTLDPATPTIPVVGASFADGVALAQPGSTARVRVLPSETRTDFNVIAEKEGTNTNNVVMAGAHLDSVTAGPGINDNGSGSAALLETALMMSKLKPENTVRFAWWAAEELGLIGSEDYVDGLSAAERDRIALYMNYDMVGSPNYIFMVYDADESTFVAEDFGVTVPPGSTAIEDVYESYYTMVGEPYDDTAFDGRSDYEAFILNGIPAGGLFTGAEEPKTEAQAAIWGGDVDEQFDPCYHEDCDVFGNVNLHALDVNSDLIAFAMLYFAYTTESVNGVPGKNIPGGINLPTPAGPEGTFAEEGGGRGPGLMAS
ncbi:MAG TPA: M28 family peptidase [Acidimicrobiales bacterium]|jgi:Zn-dependent M28 family amino/carboxypeptidase|nr:M28 family peptidase [Acidimicrobiales bacterium]